MNERLTESFLSILRNQAYENFWDGESDLETYLQESSSLAASFVAYGPGSLSYEDMFQYVFRGVITDSFKALVVAYLGDATVEQIPEDHTLITVFTVDDPHTGVFTRDLFDVKAAD